MKNNPDDYVSKVVGAASQVDAAEWRAREPARTIDPSSRAGMGRELFGLMRANAGTAEQGACSLFVTLHEDAQVEVA